MVSEGCVMGLCTVCESGVSVCFFYRFAKRLWKFREGRVKAL